MARGYKRFNQFACERGGLLDVGNGEQKRILFLDDVELNDRGDFIFYAQLGDGSAGIFVSTIPEPSAVALLSTALLLFAVYPGRRLLLSR